MVHSEFLYPLYSKKRNKFGSAMGRLALVLGGCFPLLIFHKGSYNNFCKSGGNANSIAFSGELLAW
jgi:hypothetical protein